MYIYVNINFDTFDNNLTFIYYIIYKIHTL